MNNSHYLRTGSDTRSILVVLDWRIRSALVALCVFSTFFITKLLGYIDIPLVALTLLLIFGHRSARLSRSDGTIELYFLALCIFASYGLLISILYGADEVIFALKFVRTLILFTLSYFAWRVVSNYWSYEHFLKNFVLMVVVHSIIVLACVTVPAVRESIYPITGFEPRGPAWLRSAGLTISYNSPTILHVVGLWLIVSRRYWSVLVRLAFGVTIFASMIFMGRTIAFIGILMIGAYLIFFADARRRRVGIVVLALLALAVSASQGPLRSEIPDEVNAAIDRFVDPLRAFGSVGGIDSYYQDNLVNHLYVSRDAATIFFGNSKAGHIGLLDSRGETDSDIGLVNSVNANGIFITFLIYVFYISMFWQVRRTDWKTISFLVVLPVALSLKETGLFTSHATPALFFTFFYLWSSVDRASPAHAARSAG